MLKPSPARGSYSLLISAVPMLSRQKPDTWSLLIDLSGSLPAPSSTVTHFFSSSLDLYLPHHHFFVSTSTSFPVIPHNKESWALVSSIQYKHCILLKWQIVILFGNNSCQMIFNKASAASFIFDIWLHISNSTVQLHCLCRCTNISQTVFCDLLKLNLFKRHRCMQVDRWISDPRAAYCTWLPSEISPPPSEVELFYFILLFALADWCTRHRKQTQQFSQLIKTFVYKLIWWHILVAQHMIAFYASLNNISSFTFSHLILHVLENVLHCF